MMRRTSPRLVRALIVAFSIVGAASGCREPQVGGCDEETITIGTGMTRGEEPQAHPGWIRIGSVEFAGTEIYREAALDLTGTLDSLGIEIYNRSELIHIRKGPCWPLYAISLSVNAKMGGDQRIRTRLLQTPVADLAATVERPEGYGLFFITCGWGSTESWTLWYPKPAILKPPR